MLNSCLECMWKWRWEFIARELKALFQCQTYNGGNVCFHCRVDEEIRLNSIKINLEKTLRGQDEDSLISNAEFDYALAAVCEMPRHFNISDWFGQKSWNIFFKPTYRQYNVKSVMLRWDENASSLMFIPQLAIYLFPDCSKSPCQTSRRRGNARLTLVNSINTPSRCTIVNEVIIASFVTISKKNSVALNFKNTCNRGNQEESHLRPDDSAQF